MSGYESHAELDEDHRPALRRHRQRGLTCRHDAELKLHGDYVDMAVANGLPADHPLLGSCRRGSYGGVA